MVKLPTADDASLEVGASNPQKRYFKSRKRSWEGLDPNSSSTRGFLSICIKASSIEGKIDFLIMSADGHMSTQCHQEVVYQGGPQQRGGRRGGLRGREYHRQQEESPRQEACHDDNFYEDYGDNPNIGKHTMVATMVINKGIKH
ncbi:hypothetical protein M9H77_12596 [Catharanthus roseus]|uniref:Uncharacterized protein n=1 Tax=Catharanthus roseus TaxID=4058 RepID=A0ACC0BHW2_CATRO|nr:hypothetical protein M9H77_12596 [Catharanthus roseus]